MSKKQPKDYAEHDTPHIERIKQFNQFIPTVLNSEHSDLRNTEGFLNVITGCFVTDVKPGFLGKFLASDHKPTLEITWMQRNTSSTAHTFVLQGEELEKFMNVMEIQSNQYQF